MTASYTDQVGFRIRSGDTVGLNADSGWLAAQNTNGSMNVDTTFRIRLEVQESNNKNEVVSGQLEARLNTGSWFNVSGITTVVKAVASGQFADDDPTSDLLTAGAGTFVAGSGSHDGFASNVALQNTHTEIEFSIQIVSADVANNDTIELRLAAIDNWTVTPQITVIETTTINGTLAKTLANMTLAGTGTQLNEGTLAETLANMTATGTGTQLNEGTLAKTLANMTATGTGTQLNEGVLAKTLANMTCAGTGTVGSTPIEGALTKTLADMTLVGTADIPVRGVLLRRQLLDDFNRSDGPVGSNWTVSAGSAPSISSNRLLYDSILGTSQQMYWNQAEYSYDQFASFKLTDITATHNDTSISVVVRMHTSTKFLLAVYRPYQSHIQIYEVNGTFRSTGTYNGISFSVGDTFTVIADVSNLYVYKNGSLLFTHALTYASDYNYDPATSIGIRNYLAPATSDAIGVDDFSGGAVGQLANMTLAGTGTQVNDGVLAETLDAMTCSATATAVTVIEGSLIETLDAMVGVGFVSIPPFLLYDSTYIAASGANTTAQLTAPSGKTTADFVAGRIQDDENPADSIDITAGDYTELEWSLQAQNLVINDVYQFRVTSSGLALNSYSVTPEATIVNEVELTETLDAMTGAGTATVGGGSTNATLSETLDNMTASATGEQVNDAVLAETLGAMTATGTAEVLISGKANTLLFSDSFTDDNNVHLPSHTPDVNFFGNPWVAARFENYGGLLGDLYQTEDYRITNNQAHPNLINSAVYNNVGDIVDIRKTTEFTIVADFIVPDPIGEARYIIAFHSNGLFDDYEPECYTFNPRFDLGDCRFRKMVDGSETVVDTQSYSFSAGTTYRAKVVVNGTNYKCYIDDNLVLDITDSSYQDYPFFGIGKLSSSSDTPIDNLSVTTPLIQLADMTCTGTGEQLNEGTLAETLGEMTGDATGVGSNTASLAETLADMTASGTGEQVNEASLNETLADTTSSATATQLNEGTLAKTLANMTCAATVIGQQTTDANLAETLANMTLTGTGEQVNNATLGETLADTTSSASADVICDSNLAETLASMTCSATGEQVNNATLAETLSNMTLAGTATQVNDATLGETLANTTISATAEQLINNVSLAKTLANTTSSATAEVDITATLSVTLVGSSGVGDGDVPIVANLSKGLDSMTCAATGEQVNNATLAETLSNTTLTGTVAQVNDATLSETFDAMTCSATSIGSYTASLDEALSNMTLTGTGEQVNDGVLAETLANTTLSGTVTTAAGNCSLNQTLSDMTVSGTGNVDIDASLSKTLGDTTSSATAEQVNDASLSETLSAMTADGTATVDITASLDETLDNTTCSATAEGTQSTNAVLAETLENMTSAGVGVVSIAGTLDETLAEMTLAGTGEQVNSAQVSTTLANMVSAGNADVFVTSSLSSNLEEMTCEASATSQTVSLAALNITFEDMSGAGTVSVDVEGVDTSTLDDMTCVATAVVPIIANTNVTLEGTNCDANIFNEILGQVVVTLENMTCVAIIPTYHSELSATITLVDRDITITKERTLKAFIVEERDIYAEVTEWQQQ